MKPSDIPEAFDVDVSGLGIGDSITVGDIREKSKFEILNDDNHSLVLISAPRTEAEMDELDSDSGTTDAEPEVIGEDDKE